MTPREILLYPGRWSTDHILIWFFEISPQSIDPQLYNISVFILTLFFWAWLIGVIKAVIRKLFGFEDRRMQR